MNFKTLQSTPAWEWPTDAGKTIRAVLVDADASVEDRATAALLAGDCVVIDELLVGALLSVVRSSKESEQLRGIAAIAFGPVLEMESEDDEDVPVPPKVLRQVQKALRALHDDEAAPALVRRRALEASVRNPEPWHNKAISSAYERGGDWRVTALFCMRYVPGFDDKILASLTQKDPDMLLEAVAAAGVRELESAWGVVRPLLTLQTKKNLLLAAIEASAGLCPNDLDDAFDPLRESKDEDILNALEEAEALADAAREYGEELDDD
jgi:hypothetical protein